MGDPEADYEISVEEALSSLENGDNMLGLEQAKKMMAEDDNVALIDLRTLVEFNQGHIEGAVNVPFAELLTGESQDFFLDDEAKHFVLYGNSASQSSNAWMVLNQVGCQKVQFIPGNYDVVSNEIEDVPLDIAAHDYKAIFEEVQKKETDLISVGKVTKPKPQPKKVVVAPPKPVKKKRRLEGC
jgi:rhodanese-related sulfurtransferase